MRQFNRYQWDNLGARADLSSFEPDCGVAEYHAILHIEPQGQLFTDQYARLLSAENLLLALPQFKGACIVFKRYFLSDACNQVPLMTELDDASVSFIQQPPLDGSKVALWVYAQKGVSMTSDDGVITVEHNGYTQLWKMGMTTNIGDSEQQTAALLEDYEAMLAKHGGTIADNCIRTWFYVRDVDTQYAGMVRARKANFEENGLTPQTHYVSSTGIGGLPADPKAIIQLGTCSLLGFEPGQQRYLYARSHLNKTIEYGVTFERGTLVEFGDRGHVYISGTASIDNKGNVLHLGDVRRQTLRMWENVEKLLEEGGMGFDDVMQIVAYLRDMADYDVVSHMFAEKFPHVPYVLTLAPVCRPAWLIEMECIAVDRRENKQYRDF